MRTDLRCTVYVAGEPFACGAPGDNPLAPTVLSGLQITWGRSTTVDQPEASTCSFQVLDELGGTSFIQQLRTGLPVEVNTTGTLYPDPTEGTFLDPDLENPDPPVILTNATAVSGGGELQVNPLDGSRAMKLVFAPAPFVPAGTSPDAWDAIPQTSGGQLWSYSITLTLPEYAAAEVRPVLFSGPWADAGTVLDQPQPVPAGPGPVTVTGEFDPSSTGAWVGIELRVHPTGPRWVDLDPAATWAGWDPAQTWLDLDRVLVDTVNAFSPAGGVEITIGVFAGRITDLKASWDDAADAPVVDVTAADFTADLDNVRVGDEPWAVERLQDRIERILTLSGQPVTADIPASIAGVLISYQDVDSQPVTGLLKDIVQSADGVMWSATHRTTGPYIAVEDPSDRAPLSHLELVDGVVVIVSSTSPGDQALAISACDILRDPVEWIQDVSDLTTRVAVTWKEQGVDEDGTPTTTDRTVTVVDSDLEVVYGQRGASVSTLLQDADDAREIAGRILARTSQYGWRASGLYIDEDTIEVPPASTTTMLLHLLDGTRRNGAPLRITDLPEWSPPGSQVGVYLEGGTYTFADGFWQLDMTVSNATAAGRGIAWSELDPAWRWVDFYPSMAWSDLYGVGPAPVP